MERSRFEQLAVAELDAVYRFARFLSGDADRAEELVQDVYARAFRRETIEGFTSRGAGMRAWLMTIARNSYYGQLEHERAGRRAIARITHDAMSQGNSAETLDPAESSEIDWTLASSRMHEAMASMSVELRDVLWFWGVEGLKYREIAEAMEIPIGTVMSRLHRARTQAARFLRNDAALAPQLAHAGIIEPRTEAQASEPRE